MQILISALHIIVCFTLIIVVLLQAGRGGGLGAGFGGGASTQVFGGRGAGGFLRQITTSAAVLFFLTSFALAVLSSQKTSIVQQRLSKPASAITGTATGDDEDAANEDAAAADADAAVDGDEAPVVTDDAAAPEAGTDAGPEDPAPAAADSEPTED